MRLKGSSLKTIADTINNFITIIEFVKKPNALYKIAIDIDSNIDNLCFEGYEIVNHDRLINCPVLCLYIYFFFPGGIKTEENAVNAIGINNLVLLEKNI